METPQPLNPNPQANAETDANSTPNPGGQTPPPRAFAQGTGVVLQTVGMVMFLSTCCVCSFAGMWDPPMSRAQVIEQLQQDRPLGVTLNNLWDQPAKAGMMLMVMFMTIGGLAMAGFGLGMQSERPRSAPAAMATNLLMLAVLTLAGIGIWADTATWRVRLWHGLLTGVIIVVTGFTWAAWKEIRKNPPPANPPPAPPTDV